LVLGLYDKKGAPNYVGNVGSGFNFEMLDCMRRDFDKLKVTSPPLNVVNLKKVLGLSQNLL